MTLYAFIDGTSQNGKGGMMIDLPIKNGEDWGGIMEFIQVMKENSNGLFDAITVVKSSKHPITAPYLHPPLSHQANPDGSYEIEGKVWFELIISVML
jgi:hypothetical protein